MPEAPPEPPSPDALRARWRTCLALTAGLMLVGAGVTFGVAWYARALDGPLFGWPLSFWIAAQGAPVLYLLLVVLYARTMRRLDARHGADEDA